MFHLIVFLLVERLDLLNFLKAAHEDARPIVDMLRNNVEHAAHLAVDCLATSCRDTTC